MKKTLTFIILFVLTSILLISCQPQEIQPLCKQVYGELLAADPDYPPSFIGFCIATIQSGKPVGYQGVCHSESFWLSMPDLFGDEGLVITSRQECISYIESLE